MLLRFIVSQQGIELDPMKVKAIRYMPAPRIKKQVRSFLGRINYIARFIMQLTTTCDPLFYKDRMHGWMSSSFWQDQAVFVEPSHFGPPYAGTSVDSIPNSARYIHGLHVRLVKGVWSKGEGDLLPKYEDHQLRDQLHAILYHAVDFLLSQERSPIGRCCYLSLILCLQSERPSRV